MPACPNCGRVTLRTKDWACQWCGYPILSRAYQKIDKTFKQLQEEKKLALKADYPVSEPESEFKLESEPELGPEPEVASEPPPQPERKIRLAPEPRPKPEEKLAPMAALKQEPEPALEPVPEPLPAPEPAPQLAPGPVLEQLPEPGPAPQLAPKPVPEPLPEPGPALVAALNLDTLTDGAALSVDDLDALYKANRLGAHARLTNKTIFIKGFVEKVFIRDHIDVRYIVLTGARKKVSWPIRCAFVKENMPQMNRLVEGQEVTMRGKYDSYGKNIIFKDCVLV